MNFFDFEGNDSLKAELEGLSLHSRIPHAVIIEGADDAKRRELAKLLAMWAVCSEQSTNRPCGVCNNCLKAAGNTHSDIIVAKGSGKTDAISVDEVRAITKDSVIIANEAPTKVYLFFDADKRMQSVSQNAFLKTLEEPPQNVMFILTCEKSSSLLTTIRSRSTVFTLNSNSHTNEETLLLAQQIVLAIIATKEIPLLLLTAKLNQRETAKNVLPCVSNILRNALEISCGSTADISNEAAQKIAYKLTKARIMKLIDLTSDALVKIDQNVNINLLTTWLCGEFRRIAWQR